MNWKRTAIAAAVFVVMLLVYGLDLRIREGRRLQDFNEASLAPGIHKSQVVEVRVTNDDGEIVLVREGEGWSVTEPFRAQADSEVVDQIITNVTGAVKRNEFEARNLAEYGLVAPKATVFFRAQDGSAFELLVGNESTYTDQVFARLPGTNSVFTVRAYVRNVLLRAPADFRRSRLLEIDPSALDSYTLVEIRDGRDVTRLANERGAWRIVEPFTAPAEGPIVEDYLRTAGLLRADTFVTERSDRPTSLAVALDALTSPGVSVSVDRAGVPRTAVELSPVTGSDGRRVFVARRPGEREIMAVRPSSVESLAPGSDYFRSRDLFTLRPADVAIFSVEIGRARTDLTLSDEGVWEFLGNPDERVDQREVADRLELLLRTRIRDYVDMEPRDASIYGLTPPRSRFTVSSLDRQTVEGIEVGSSEAGNPSTVYARRRGDRSVFTIDISSDLFIVPETVLDRHFARFDPARVRRFTIDLGGATHELRIENNQWAVLRPGQDAPTLIAQDAMQRFLAALDRIAFERSFEPGAMIVAPGDVPQFTVAALDAAGNVVMEFSAGKRMQTTTLVRTADGRNLEVGNSQIAQFEAILRSVVK